MISIEQIGNVALVTLGRGVTNPINPTFVNEITERTEGIRNDPNVSGLVLCSSSEKFFSIGFDIPELYDMSQEDFSTFYKSFNRACIEIFTMPKPTIAAIGGHAIAGGAILALCCDGRYMAEGRNLMGLNEVKLGVPVPYLADCILRSLVDARHAREIMEKGEFFNPEICLQMGLVDRILPFDQVIEKAIADVETTGLNPITAFAEIKRNRVDTVLDQYIKRYEEKQDAFITFWYSERARPLIKEAIKKF